MKYLFFILMTSTITSTRAQSNAGPKLTAMGISTTSISDTFNTHSNPAIITVQKKTIIALSYLKYMVDDQWSEQIFNLIWPLKPLSLAVTFYRSGFSEMNEMETCLTVARSFGEHLRLGLKINYQKLTIASYGANASVSADIGATYQLDTSWSFGLHIANLTMSRHKPDVAHILKRIFSLGMSSQLSDKIILATTLHCDAKWKLNPSIGLDVQIITAFSLRTGLAFRPLRQYFGTGLKINKITIDLSVETHQSFAQKPQMGLSYAF